MVREVFGIDSVVLPDPVSGTPMVVPRSRHRARATPATPAEP